MSFCREILSLARPPKTSREAEGLLQKGIKDPNIHDAIKVDKCTRTRQFTCLASDLRCDVDVYCRYYSAYREQKSQTPQALNRLLFSI